MQNPTYDFFNINQTSLYLYWDSVPDVSRQELQHLHVAAQQAQCVGAGVDFSVCVFVAERVDDVHHDGGGVGHGVGLPVCWLTHFVSLHCAVKRSQIIIQHLS